MAIPIALPKLGMTMEDATIINWLKPNGAAVREGEALVEVETEKVTFEVESPADGILEIAVEADQTLSVGDMLGYVLAENESRPTQTPPVAAVVAGPPTSNGAMAVRALAEVDTEVRASPAARALARAEHVDLAGVRGTGPEGRIKEAEVRAFLVRRDSTEIKVPVAQAVVVAPSKRPGAGMSPLARRAAAQSGIDPASVQGTGHLGRVMRADVERAVAASMPSGVRKDLREPVRGMRRTIAQRMQRSLQEMAQLTITMKADMTETVRLRQRLLAQWEPLGIRPTYTDIVVRVTAAALREHPNLNARIEGDEIVQMGAVNIGLSVALDDGLIVPVIHDADTLPLRDIARRTRELAASARSRSLSPAQVQGGTFTVSSLGAYGVETFTPIINLPEAAILGVGAIQTEAAFDGDRVFPREVLRLSLSFDHRLIDGAPAAEFLRTIVRLLEQPYLLL